MPEQIFPKHGRIPVPLRLCRGCHEFVRIENELCDFCGGDLAVLEADHADTAANLHQAMSALRGALAASRASDGLA
jgi:hypothetical protein